MMVDFAAREGILLAVKSSSVNLHDFSFVSFSFSCLPFAVIGIAEEMLLTSCAF